MLRWAGVAEPRLRGSGAGSAPCSLRTLLIVFRPIWFVW